MRWIDRIKSEIKEKKIAQEFVRDSLKPTYDRFLNYAFQETDTINSELFEGQSIYKVEEIPQNHRVFTVLIDKAPKSRMTVTFEAKENHISITRFLQREENLLNLPPDTIMVKAEPGRTITCFDPPVFSGKYNSDQIPENFLIRFLTEPVIRAHFGLPQISLSKEFAR